MRPFALPSLAFLIAFAAALSFPARGQAVVATIPAGDTPRAIAIDAQRNRIYVANEFSNNVTVIDGATHATTTVPVGVRPQYIAASAALDKAYVTSGSDATLAVIDGPTLAVKKLAIGSNGPIAVNAAANKIYVVRLSTAATDEVTIVDGTNDTWFSIATGSFQPVDIGLNLNTNTMYVAHYATGDVRVVSATPQSDFPPTTSIGTWSRPVALAVNPNTNKVYVIDEDSRGPIVVIDGATNTAVSFAPAGHAQGPRAIAVNPLTNKVYAAFNGEVVQIDGATNALAFIPTGTAVGIAVDAALDRIYVPDAQGTLTVIDGATRGTTRIPIPVGAKAVAVNPATHRVYVAGPAVSEIDPGSAPPPPPPAAAIDVQGLWWAAPPGSESGWGVNLSHQGDIVFATWFTYDTDGSGLWLVMSNGARVGTDTYSGTLYRATGPGFNTAFDPARVHLAAVGSATFAFTDANNGTFSYTVNGVTQAKAITREIFASPVPSCTLGGSAGASPNYQDLWWNAPAGSESGWGLNLTHQGDVIFLTWFTYDADGKGMWIFGSNLARTGNATYSGALYRASGAPFSMQPWPSSSVAITPVGRATLTFTDADNGTFEYTVDGVAGSKSITREAFSSPRTVCR